MKAISLFIAIDKFIDIKIFFAFVQPIPKNGNKTLPANYIPTAVMFIYYLDNPTKSH